MPMSRVAGPAAIPQATSSGHFSGNDTASSTVPWLFPSSRDQHSASEAPRNMRKATTSYGARPLSMMPPPVYTGYSPLSQGRSAWPGQLPPTAGGWVQFGVASNGLKQPQQKSDGQPDSNGGHVESGSLKGLPQRRPPPPPPRGAYA